MLVHENDYDTLYRNFSWNIPEYYNIGVDVCDRLAFQMPHKTAIIDVSDNGRAADISFAQLKSLSNRLANALANAGVAHRYDGSPDRVGVLLPQRFETAVAHIAVFKLGCISIPLFTLFGEDALLHRLRDSGAKVVITDKAGSDKVMRLRDQLPDLCCILSVDGADEGVTDFATACYAQSDTFSVVRTKAEDPALLIYTSGTTGNPKGVLHAHRVLLGHLPGVEMAFNFLPHEDDRFWTPADWAWIGGLLDVLMPSLHHGITVVAHRFSRFDPVAALDLMQSHQVKNVFLPPTAIKIMRNEHDTEHMSLKLRSVASGGETLGVEVSDWCKEVLDADVNEFYGQTECNMIVSCCSALEPSTPGVMGHAVPGHRVDIIDAVTGAVVEDNAEGTIAVLSPDPVMFLEYWGNPQATEDKFINGPDGRWLLTGDRGIRLTNGKLKFVGREDDVIASAGYRIGPAEIEDCLLKHPAIQLAGAVAKPDKIRGSVVAVYLKLKQGETPSSALASEISDFVKTRLAAHEYPRVVRFLNEMPMTTTGKIIRAELRVLAEAEYQREQER